MGPRWGLGGALAGPRALAGASVGGWFRHGSSPHVEDQELRTIQYGVGPAVLKPVAMTQWSCMVSSGEWIVDRWMDGWMDGWMGRHARPKPRTVSR